jgi:hypothetical protein
VAAAAGNYRAGMDTSWEPIPSQRCWQLLATTSIGRLALSVRALPVILPVQYYLSGQRIAACLGHREIPERSLNGAIIAFSADAIDPATRSGWSVQIQGRSFDVRHGDLGAGCGQLAIGQVVEIEPGTITGFHVRQCPFIDTVLADPQHPV